MDGEFATLGPLWPTSVEVIGQLLVPRTDEKTLVPNEHTEKTRAGKEPKTMSCMWNLQKISTMRYSHATLFCWPSGPKDANHVTMHTEVWYFIGLSYLKSTLS